ncbi:unnamed protein product, partial [Ectocarpus sp. 8 AP-2014]
GPHHTQHTHGSKNPHEKNGKNRNKKHPMCKATKKKVPKVGSRAAIRKPEKQGAAQGGQNDRHPHNITYQEIHQEMGRKHHRTPHQFGANDEITAKNIIGHP